MPNKSFYVKIKLACSTLCFIWFSLAAQNTERVGLLKVLESIETTFDVRISYSGTEVDTLAISFEMQPTLEANLRQIEQQIPFEFHQLDERYITLVKNTEDFLCGKILAADSGLPLSDATIISNLTLYGTLTNTDGTFRIPKSLLDEEIVVQYVGYQTWQIPVSELTEDCVIILIPPEVLTLETIFIKRYFVEGLEKKIDGSFTINTSELGLLPGLVENDILLATQALPGVQSVNETISNINVRGGTHDENLILWNDIKAYQSGHFFGLISAFNPDITKTVKIYKNGTPIVYSESISSVISMRSNDQIATEFSGNAGVNFINGSVSAEVPISEQASLQVAARSSINSLWESPVYRSYSEKVFQDTEITNPDDNNSGLDIVANEEFGFYDFSTRLLWDKTEKDKFRVNFLTMKNSLDFNESLVTTSRSKTSELELKSFLTGLSWEREWSESLTTRAMAYGTTYYLRALNKDLLTTQEVFQENDVLETGLKLNANLSISDRLSVLSGYQFTETGITNEQEVNLPRFVDLDKQVLRVHSAFSSIQFNSSNDKTHINAGIRVNYFEKFGKINFEPRLALNQKLLKNISLEILGELKSQTTTQRIDFESDFLGVEKRRWVLADEDNFPIISSRQISTGLVYENNGWILNIDGYYKEVDGISSANQGFQNQFQFERSTGNYTAHGLEFVVNKNHKNYSFWFSYSYLDDEYAFNSFMPSVFPHNLDITHSGTMAATYSINRLKIAAGLNYRNGKPYTIPRSQNSIVTEGITKVIAFDSPNGARLPDYYRLDVSAEYAWQISRSIDAKINAALLNALGIKNTLNIRYALVENASNQTVINEIRTFSVGLTPNFSFKLSF